MQKFSLAVEISLSRFAGLVFKNELLRAHFQILSKRLMTKDYYSLTEVARTLGISRQAVHKRIKRNKLKAMKVGTTYIIGKEEVKKLKE